jgi:hypothetical protein
MKMQSVLAGNVWRISIPRVLEKVHSDMGGCNHELQLHCSVLITQLTLVAYRIARD